MFVNFSNHPVERWGKEQKQAAQEFGEIRDFPFPDVPAVTTTEEIIRMAEKCSKEIILLNPDCVMSGRIYFNCVSGKEAAGSRHTLCMCLFGKKNVGRATSGRSDEENICIRILSVSGVRKIGIRGGKV